MQNIKLSVNYHHLVALNQVWAAIEFISTDSPKNRAVISMANRLANRLLKKEMDLLYGTKKEKQHSINLKYYEAYFLEILMHKALQIIHLEYTRSVLQKIADELNQQLA